MPGKPVFMAALAMAAMSSAPAPGADLERGRDLYEIHCQFCHSIKVHNRQQRWPSDLQQLRGVVEHWQEQQKLRWSKDEIDDVVFYLNVRQYNY
jgi:cytochrome c2